MSCNSLALALLSASERTPRCVCSLTLVVCGVISSSVLRFVRFADEFGASGNIETKEQGKRKPQMLQSLFITYVEYVLSASVK